MKDVMNKALLFDGKAMITVWSMPHAAEEGARLHNMTDDAANVYGRVLAVSAYMAAGLKSESDKLTVIVEGDGKLGRIVACGECGAKVRGYVSNPREVLRAGEQPSAMVGGEGVISVIKDMGMEQPYRGYGKVVKGDITSDFAGYLDDMDDLESSVKVGIAEILRELDQPEAEEQAEEAPVAAEEPQEEPEPQRAIFRALKKRGSEKKESKQQTPPIEPVAEKKPAAATPRAAERANKMTAVSSDDDIGIAVSVNPKNIVNG